MSMSDFATQKVRVQVYDGIQHFDGRDIQHLTSHVMFEFLVEFYL